MYGVPTVSNSQKDLGKKLIYLLLASWKALEKRSGSGSVSKRHGSGTMVAPLATKFTNKMMWNFTAPQWAFIALLDYERNDKRFLENSQHQKSYVLLAVLWIRIAVMRIRIRLITLMWTRILILFDSDPDFYLMRIRIQLFILMRTRIQILASKYRLKSFEKLL